MISVHQSVGSLVPRPHTGPGNEARCRVSSVWTVWAIREDHSHFLSKLKPGSCQVASHQDVDGLGMGDIIL